MSPRLVDVRRLPASALQTLRSMKAGRTVSVCIPARDEEATIGQVVGEVHNELVRPGLVDELLVVNDGSTDATQEEAQRAGARVIDAASVLPELATGRGKGQAMWKAVYETEGDLLVFCDGDVTNFRADFVTRLLSPLLVNPALAMVKPFYERPLKGEQGGGGRVTELMARPLLNVLFPHLAHVRQPLAGETAAPRQVLEQVPFCDGYGVELGLLVDVAALFTPAAIAQVDLGERSHRNRPISELAPQAEAILRVGLDRAGMIRTAPEDDASPLQERSPLVQIASYRRRSA